MNRSDSADVAVDVPLLTKEQSRSSPDPEDIASLAAAATNENGLSATTPLIPTHAEPDPTVRLPYPKSVSFIIGNEFCERFSFYGMKTILFVYLTNFLHFEEPSARAILHVFVMLAYFFPLFGGILSDSYWGKFRTILYLSLVYCVGNLVLAVTSIPGITGNPPHWWGLALGLALLAIGTGGIKPCVSAFGGDQFHPSQVLEIQTFFSFFYFAINAGSMLSTFLTPELRSVPCMGLKSCYPLAFGVPAILMVVATIIFVSGYRLYKIIPPGKNVIVETLSVITGAIRARRQSEDSAEREEEIAHWLDYAIPAYGRQTVSDIKVLLGILFMFLPLPLFWTLFDQQASFWVEQAMKMRTDVRIFGSTVNIKPEQMQLTNALLILIMIPLFDRLLYPLLTRLGFPLLPLKRMAIGMALTGFSYIVAGLLQVQVEESVVSYDPEIHCVSNCVHILWQVPQYIVITAGEIMFSITGLEFAYSQAPKSMKSVCQACWLLTVAIGNLVVVVIAGAKLFDRASKEFFFYAVLIFLAMLIFSVMAAGYQYVSRETAEEEEAEVKLDDEHVDNEEEPVHRSSQENA